MIRLGIEDGRVSPEKRDSLWHAQVDQLNRVEVQRRNERFNHADAIGVEEDHIGGVDTRMKAYEGSPGHVGVEDLPAFEQRAAHLCRGLGGRLRQPPHFHSNHGKALAGIARPGSLNRGIECQKIGLQAWPACTHM